VKTKNYKNLMAFLTLLALVLPLGELCSQDLINQTNGTIDNKGTIKFVQDAGHFTNNASGATDVAVRNGSGTIEFTADMTTEYDMFDGGNPLGLDAASRIQGYIKYSGTSGTQYLQGIYMASLALEGDALKNFGSGPDQFFVDSIYTVADGARDYTDSRFTYDGEKNTANANDQIIVGENGAAGANNIYYELYFAKGGTKTLEAGEWAHAEYEINIDDSAIVLVQGKMEAIENALVNTLASAAPGETGLLLLDGTTKDNAEDGWFITNSGEGELDGDIFAYNEGQYQVNGDGVQTFSGYVTVGEDQAATESSGTIAVGGEYVAIFDGDGSLGVLDLKNVNGAIYAGDAAITRFTGGLGSFINGVVYTTTRSNMLFHVNSEAYYSGDAELVGTHEEYPYGNVIVDATASTGDAAPEGATGDNGIDVYLAGNLTVDGRNLLMDNNVNPTDGSQALVMLDNQKTVTYPEDDDGDIEEVVGEFRRYYNWSGETGDYSEGTALTFNNRATTVGIYDDDDNEYLEWFGMSTYPGTAPTPSDPFNPNTDIKRRTALTFNETAQGWSAEIQLGFLSDEAPGTPGDWTNDDWLNSFRFRKYIDGNPSQKLSTGFEVARHNTYDVDNFAWASLAGITSNTSASLTSAIIDDGSTYGDEIFLRGGPTWFITVACGRWSTGGTWDEGFQPGPNDLALVRHTVHAGYVRQSDPTGTAREDDHLDDFDTDESHMAAYIQVFSGDLDGTEYDGALLLGSGDNTTEEIADPAWGINNTVDLSGFNFKSPFRAGDADVDGSVDDGNFWVTQIQQYEAAGTTNALPDVLSDINDGAASNYDIRGGLIVFTGAEFTVPEIYTNHGHLLNGGTVIVGE
jgi:hypothetical protein